MVDVDILNMDKNKEHINKAYEAYGEKQSLPSDEPSVEVKMNNTHPGLDTELNEHTIEALANLPDDDDMSDHKNTDTTVSKGEHVTCGHATFNGIKLTDKKGGML